MSKKEELLIQTAKIIEDEGIQAFTIDYLAQKCELTKGGVLYHFKNKSNLLIKMNEMIIEQFESVLENFKKDLSGSYLFTRAYAKATIYYLENREQAFLPALLMTSLEDDACLKLWKETTKKWDDLFENDGKNKRAILNTRLISDGIWYSMMYNDNDLLNDKMKTLLLDACHDLEKEEA